MTDSARNSSASTPALAALIAGWVLPGLGHYLIGEKKRGLILLCGLYGLFGAGLLVGGIDVIDRRQDTLWYAGQVLIGPPAIALDKWRESMRKSVSPPGPMPSSAGFGTPPYSISIGRPNELGTLYCTLAGVLNLLVLVDLFGRIFEGSSPEGEGASARADSAPGASS